MPRLRTVALLMLAAGVSLGVFATKAASAWRLDAARSVRAAAPFIEERVRLYRTNYHLDDARADLVRQELVRFDHRVMDKIWELRQQNAAWFEQVARETDGRILAILRPGAPPSPEDPDAPEAPPGR